MTNPRSPIYKRSCHRLPRAATATSRPAAAIREPMPSNLDAARLRGSLSIAAARPRVLRLIARAYSRTPGRCRRVVLARTLGRGCRGDRPVAPTDPRHASGSYAPTNAALRDDPVHPPPIGTALVVLAHVDAELLALLVEMAAFEVETAGGVGHVAAQLAQALADHRALEVLDQVVQ